MTRSKTNSEIYAGMPEESIPEIASELRDLALEESITIGQCEFLRQVANLIEHMDFVIHSNSIAA